ncbi:MAG: seryl-tRNA synthetase, partial [uncultured bacterium]
MIDPKLLRHDPDSIAREAKRHNVDIDIAIYKSLEAERKSLQDKTQELQAKRNQFAKQVGMAKSKGEDVAALLSENQQVGDSLKQSEMALDALQ